MSDEDKARWDQRYSTGSYRARSYASPLLVSWVDELALVPGARVLDLGCGSGRNSLYLASRGFDVTGLDISRVAIAQAEDKARDRDLSVTFRQADLDLPITESGFDFVIMVRYMNRQMFPRIPGLLSRSAYFLAEHHVATNHDVAGPQPTQCDDFRLRPGELRKAMASLQFIHCDESISRDRDGRPVALAQLVATNAVSATDVVRGH